MCFLRNLRPCILKDPCFLVFSQLQPSFDQRRDGVEVSDPTRCSSVSSTISPTPWTWAFRDPPRTHRGICFGSSCIVFSTPRRSAPSHPTARVGPTLPSSSFPRQSNSRRVASIAFPLSSVSLNRSHSRSLSIDLTVGLSQSISQSVSLNRSYTRSLPIALALYLSRSLNNSQSQPPCSCVCVLQVSLTAQPDPSASMDGRQIPSAGLKKLKPNTRTAN